MKEERPADVKERQQKLKKRDRQILKRETTDIKEERPTDGKERPTDVEGERPADGGEGFIKGLSSAVVKASPLLTHHWSFRMSRQMAPVTELMLGCQIFVMNRTWQDDRDPVSVPVTGDRM